MANAVVLPATGSITVTAPGSVPSSAAIVLANLSIAAPAGSGFLTAYPAGSTRPATQNLSFSSGRPQAGLAAIRVSSARQFTIYNNSTVQVTVTASVYGYYLTGNPTVAGSFQKVAPASLFTATIPASAATNQTVTGKAAIPSGGVTAVAVQLTATAAKATTGYLSGYAHRRCEANTSAGAVQHRTDHDQPGLRTRQQRRVGQHLQRLHGAVTVTAEIVGYYLGTSRLTWAQPTQVNTSGPPEFSAISCASATFCMAAGRTGPFFKFDGIKWALVTEHAMLQQPANDELHVNSISCVSANFSRSRRCNI